MSVKKIQTFYKNKILLSDCNNSYLYLDFNKKSLCSTVILMIKTKNM
jgi:hypothetical protein